MTSESGSIESGVWKINLKSDDPVDLFTTWHAEAKENSIIVCLSTSSSDNVPHSRHVVLRNYDKTGFLFVTDSRSRKARELRENNMRASMCTYWSYRNDKGENILRQARIEGTITIVPREEVEKIYNSDPLYSKVRAHLCHQDAPVDWHDLKQRHDELIEEVKAKKNLLPMPDHFTGYKLVPTWMEFYDAKDYFIADRLQFSKDSNGHWTHQRIAA